MPVAPRLWAISPVKAQLLSATQRAPDNIKGGCPVAELDKAVRPEVEASVLWIVYVTCPPRHVLVTDVAVEPRGMQKPTSIVTRSMSQLPMSPLNQEACKSPLRS